MSVFFRRVGCLVFGQPIARLHDQIALQEEVVFPDSLNLAPDELGHLLHDPYDLDVMLIIFYVLTHHLFQLANPGVEDLQLLPLLVELVEFGSWDGGLG